MRLARWGQPDL
ncbi:putative side tail fiber protein, partial [Escherichia coli EC1846]